MPYTIFIMYLIMSDQEYLRSFIYDESITKLQASWVTEYGIGFSVKIILEMQCINSTSINLRISGGCICSYRGFSCILCSRWEIHNPSGGSVCDLIRSLTTFVPSFQSPDFNLSPLIFPTCCLSLGKSF